MATLRTLRSFWGSVNRREYAVAVPELCVRHVVPSDAVIHCQVNITSHHARPSAPRHHVSPLTTPRPPRCQVKWNGSAPPAMIIHVRRETSVRPSFELVAGPTPEYVYSHDASKNCYNGHGCEDIDDAGTTVAAPEQCARRCDAEEDCECFVYHFDDQLCWRRKHCEPSHFLDATGYRVYTKTKPAVPTPVVARNAPVATAHGFWLDPSSTDSTKVPLGASTTLQQPASFAHDAILAITFA
jgi:hypothetical protein